MAMSACINCEGTNLFRTTSPVSAGGGYAPNYLPGLGSFLRTEKFGLVVCEDCGLVSFFASPAARAQLSSSSKWTRV